MKTYGKVIFEEILDLLQKIFKNTVNENAQKKDRFNAVSSIRTLSNIIIALAIKVQLQIGLQLTNSL